MTTTEAEIDYKAREHQWAEALREPQRIQTTGLLGEIGVGGSIVSQCCLDVACEVAGLGWEIKPLMNGDAQVLRKSNPKWGDGSSSNLPKQAQEWLGINTADPCIDFPPDLHTQGCDLEYGCDIHAVEENCEGGDKILTGMNAVNLNDDWGFTFAQIADLVDYFGLVRS